MTAIFGTVIFAMLIGIIIGINITKAWYTCRMIDDIRDMMRHGKRKR